MIPVFRPFGLIQKDQKIKAGPAGPELRYGTRKNVKLASLRYAQAAHFSDRVPAFTGVNLRFRS